MRKVSDWGVNVDSVVIEEGRHLFTVKGCDTGMQFSPSACFQLGRRRAADGAGPKASP